MLIDNNNSFMKYLKIIYTILYIPFYCLKLSNMEFQLTSKRIQDILKRSFIVKHKTSFQDNMKKEKKRENQLGTKTDMQKQNVSQKLSTSSIYIPQEKDVFFWIFYVLEYDVLQYDCLQQRYKRQQEMKNAYISEIQGDDTLKTRWKPYKLKKTDILSSIGNDTTLSLDCFIALCIMKNKNVRILKNNMYMEIFENSESNEVHHIICKDDHIELDTISHSKDEKNDTLKLNTYIKVHSFSKPLKSISSYKIAQLKEWCQRIGIIVEKKKKADLYSELQAKLN